MKAKLAELGFDSFTAYVVWACERALERGLLPHTNLGVLDRTDLANLREVTASQGLMLESVNPDLVAHQGSPTKHPERRLETIRAAGELRIPFTSGILVGIGESEDDRMASLEALAGFDHLQEVILQNFVPHRRYYGEEPADIATDAAEGFWKTGLHAGPVLGAPKWANPVSVDDMKRLIAETRRLMPDVGIQVPPNLADWWPELVEAGATDLGGLSANGDHISPEHPFPSPHQVRKRLADDGVALAERLCVYPQFIDEEWIAPRVLEVIRDRYRAFIPRRGTAATAPGTIERARDGQALGADELEALFAESRPEVIEDMRQAADDLRSELAGDTVTFVVNRNINVSNVCIVGCAFCGFGVGRRSPDAYEHDREEFVRRVHDADRVRGDRDLHAVRDPSRLGPRGLPRLAARRQGGRAAAAPARVQPDGDRAHVRRVGSRARGRAHAARTRRGSTRSPAPPPRCSTTASDSGSAPTSCRSRAGSRSSRPPTG